MGEVQELEWLEAQKIGIGKDLVADAKQQLEFLAAVDRWRVLYEEGPVLERAIYTLMYMYSNESLDSSSLLFMKVSVSSNQGGLHLRDVINRLDSLRGKGMGQHACLVFKEVFFWYQRMAKGRN